MLATIRAGKHLTLHAGYDHMSAIAIEMFLTRLLQDRTNLATAAGTVENNLIVERTARDEARADAVVDFGKVSIFADGRFRKRALATLSEDPQFQGINGQLVEPGLAYDLTIGVRDRGTFGGLRAGLWGSYIVDYQAKNLILGIELGRGFLDDRLNFDLAFLYADTRDMLANYPTPAAGCNAVTATSAASVLNACSGTRSGAEYEIGLTVSGAPSPHWFLFADYRLVADTSGGYIVAPSMVPPAPAVLPQPTIITHVLLFRIEARY